MTSHARLALVLVVAGALAVGAGCGDDDTDETRSADSTTTTESPSGGSGPGSPSGGGSLPDRPADLVGEVTQAEGGRVLVEEQPDTPDAGRKAWVAIEGPVFVREGEGDAVPAEASDVQVGQRVSAWTGICAESYPEQCGAEALVIE